MMCQYCTEDDINQDFEDWVENGDEKESDTMKYEITYRKPGILNINVKIPLGICPVSSTWPIVRFPHGSITTSQAQAICDLLNNWSEDNG